MPKLVNRAPRNRIVSVSLNTEEALRLAEIAREAGCSMSKFIRRAIEPYIALAPRSGPQHEEAQ